MNIFKPSIKLILQIFFVIIFFSTLNAKNLNKFDKGDYISNYFSGMLLLNDSQYSESYKFLKKLDGLEKSHINYSSKYLFSLINLGKFDEAFNYSKKLEKRRLGNFESDLIIGIYYFKNENFALAQKYFLKLENRKSKSVLGNFVSNSLLNWSTFNDLDLNSAQSQINRTEPSFENLKYIQNAFLHCFYKSEKTEFFFNKLTSNKEIDFSRYNYFYATYLLSVDKIKEAKKIINSSLELYPRNLLLNQYNLDLNNDQTHENNFNCQNLSHIVAEILYITANALSSQYIYTLSNFYLNLAKYLNKDFYSFDSLLAENFYKINNFEKAKKIYNEIGEKGSTFLWYAAKQNAKILIKEKKKGRSIKNFNQCISKIGRKKYL
tara:strand:- start:377 stop:1510 length:1134 start_codon:yes stop_codon:yes gene_type:complete